MAFMPNAVTPIAGRILRKPGPSPRSSRLVAAHPAPLRAALMRASGQTLAEAGAGPPPPPGGGSPHGPPRPPHELLVCAPSGPAAAPPAGRAGVGRVGLPPPNTAQEDIGGQAVYGHRDG